MHWFVHEYVLLNLVKFANTSNQASVAQNMELLTKEESKLSDITASISSTPTKWNNR